MSLRAIKYENNNLEILDQLLLPAQSKFLTINGVEDGWKVINKMQVLKPIVFSFSRALVFIFVLGAGGACDCDCRLSQFGGGVA